MKVCSCCGQNPPRGRGLSYCPPCHNEYQKAYYKRKPNTTTQSGQNRKNEIRALIVKAKDVPCADCKQRYHIHAMDLDHVRGVKKFALSTAASRYTALETVKKELKKCEAVCSNCHRVRTFTRREQLHNNNKISQKTF